MKPEEFVSIIKEGGYLPEGLKVNGDLLLDDCTGLTSLPEGLKVNGYLSLADCTGLTSLPKGLRADTIRVSGNIQNPAKFFCQLDPSLIKGVIVSDGTETLNQGWINRFYKILQSEFFKVLMVILRTNYPLPRELVRIICCTMEWPILN